MAMEWKGILAFEDVDDDDDDDDEEEEEEEKEAAVAGRSPAT